MAGVVLCEATDLYNILNQSIRVSRLAEYNYICLLDARTEDEYNESHVITARRAKWDAMGKLLIPVDVEVESMKYIVVYDSNTSLLEGPGPATECAEILAKSSRHPVQILNGGYEKFSAFYPFLRTQKILYTLKELENLQPYPVEVLRGQLYMGSYIQATNPQIHKDLKLRALVNVSEDTSDVHSPGHCLCSHDIFQSWHKSLQCYDNGIHYVPSEILIEGSLDQCAEMQNQHEAKSGFVQQLSDWELHILGKTVTDIAEPYY